MSESAAWIALPGAVAISFLWRAIGVAVSGRVHPSSDVFLWVQCVAYAMLAGLVSRMLILPTGVLAESDYWIRLAAMGVGLAVFFILKRNIFRRLNCQSDQAIHARSARSDRTRLPF